MYEKQPRKYSSIIFAMMLLGLGVYHVYAVGQLREDVRKADEDIDKLKQAQIDYSEQNKTLSEELEELESTHLQELEKIENLEEDIQNKESEIDKLNKDLQAKREREEEEARLAKVNNDKSTVLSSNKASNSEQKKGSVSTSASSVSSNRTLGSFKVTSYAVGDGMTPSTTTANGTEVANTIYSPEGHRIIAVDTSVIPMNTIVRVTMNGNSFLAKASDTGSAIKGNKIDLLVSSPSEAIKNGVQTATIEIVN